MCYDAYHEAKAEKKRNEDLRTTAKKNLQTVSNEVNSKKSEKKNLEERVEDLEKILKQFNDLDDNEIKKTTKNVKKGDEKYRKAIKNDFQVASNLETNHSVQNVNVNRYSHDAYKKIEQEKNRVLNSIKELENSIATMQRKINALKSSIKTYSSNIEYYDDEMRRALR